jgi:hypothetical protein
MYIIIIIVLLVIICISILIWILHKHKSIKYNLIQAPLQINFDTGYSKSYEIIDGNPFIRFNINFQKPPIVFGTVINLNDGGRSFDSSIYSTIYTDTDKFIPGVFQTWPTLGINYLALAQELNSPEFQFGTFVSSGVKTVFFSQTFKNIPTVIISSNQAGNSQIYITKINTNSFDFNYTNGQDRSFNYLAVGNIDELPFQIQHGKQIATPSVDNWIGGITFPYEFQDTPVVFGTPIFNKSNARECNVTVDSISRKMFHINVSGGWPEDGVCWVAISMKTTQTLSVFPINVVSGYIQEKPEEESNFFKIPINCPDPKEAVILSSPIGMMVSNSNGATIPSIVNIKSITQQEFQCCFGTNYNSEWPLGGLQYIYLSRNKTSGIPQINTPYLIDFGKFDPSSFPDHGQEIYIPFNIEFPSVPKIITSYHGVFDYEKSSSMFISKRFKTYFTLQFTGLQYWDSGFKVQFPIHWMAILETNNKQTIPPYSLQIGKIDSLKTFGSSHEVNGMQGNVFGLTFFKTKFNVAPIITLGTSSLQIDTIFSDLFHVNTTENYLLDSAYSSLIFPIYWLSIKRPDGSNEMESYQCDVKEYIDPTCKTNQDPSKCPKKTVEYLKLTTIPYLPTIAKISDSCSNSIDTTQTALPLYISQIVVCDIYLSKGTLHVDSSVPTVCSNSVNKLSKTGGVTVWNVFPDYGYFSFCDSFGNVLIRINSSFASTDLIDLEFFGKGFSTNFQFFIQFGNSNDMIYGPYKCNEMVRLQFGHLKCDPGNIACKVKEDLKAACIPAAKFLISKGTIKSINGICDELSLMLGFDCVSAAGGPENVIGDALCATVTGTTDTICKGAGKLITERTKMDPPHLAKYLCDNMFGT